MKVLLGLLLFLGINTTLVFAEDIADVSDESALVEDADGIARIWRFQCVAYDVGWEEHAGGHVAYGVFPEGARLRALAECESFHGRCTASCSRF